MQGERSPRGASKRADAGASQAASHTQPAQSAVAQFGGRFGLWSRALATSMRARRSIALRAALALGTVLSLGVALADVGAASIASQGCFAVLYAADAPYRRRAKVLVCVGGALAVSMALGTLVQGSAVLVIALGGLFASCASMLAIALRLGPPREFFPVMVFLLATQIPGDMSDAPARAGLVLLGALLAWAVSMAPALFAPARPEQRATARALSTIADLLDAVGHPTAVNARHQAIVAVRSAVAAADDASCARSVTRMEQVERLLEAVMALDLEGSPPVAPAWASCVRAIAGSAAGSASSADLPAQYDALLGARAEPQVSIAPLADLPGAARLRSALSKLIMYAEGARQDVVESEGVVLPSRWQMPRLGWVFRSPHPRVALRLGLAVSLGLLVGNALGVERAGWVATSAAAVLQGAHARVIGRRALHRALGTLVGVVLAYGVLSISHSVWIVVLSIVVLQSLVELLVVASYGLAVVLITPLVLLLAQLTGASDLEGIAQERLLDSLVGCAVAGVVLLLARRLTPIRRLSTAQASVMRALGAVLDVAFDAAHSATTLFEVRRKLQGTLLDLRVAGEEVLGDAVWSDPTADARWSITALLERGAHLALVFPVELARGEVDRAALRRSVQAMATRIEDRNRSSEPQDVREGVESGPPTLPFLPRTSAVLQELQATLRTL